MRRVPLQVLTALILASVMSAQTPVSVGMEGKARISALFPLRAKPVDEKAALAVRIAALVMQPPEHVGNHQNAYVYDVRYIGIRPGTHDLVQDLERTDGKPLTRPAHNVVITSLLPPGHKGDLHEGEESELPAFGRYTDWFLVAGILWLIPMVLTIVRIFRRRRRKEAPIVDTPPTLADQLRPLVESAVTGELDTKGKARLERLLLAHWRDRLDLTGIEPRAAIGHLRRHQEAGSLLRELEGWLHRPPGSVTVNVENVLSPYRQATAIGGV